MASEKIIIVTDDSFENEVLKSDVPVFVDFWATWCGPCRMIAPAVDEIAEKFDGKVKICKVDVDQAMQVALSFNIMSVPTFIVFKDGNIINKKIGASGADDLSDFIESCI